MRLRLGLTSACARRSLFHTDDPMNHTSSTSIKDAQHLEAEVYTSRAMPMNSARRLQVASMRKRSKGVAMICGAFARVLQNQQCAAAKVRQRAAAFVLGQVSGGLSSFIDMKGLTLSSTVSTQLVVAEKTAGVFMRLQAPGSEVPAIASSDDVLYQWPELSADRGQLQLSLVW
jgi:hypothetical protein